MVSPVRPTGRCVFCQQHGSSEEDVFAKWLTKALGGPGPHGFNLQRSAGRNKVNMSHLRVTTRAACRVCNNGWMSQLEQAVQPLLTPMIRMEPTHVASDHDKATLARWVFKTALMFDRSPKPHLWTVPAEHFRYLFQHRELPPSVTILVGCYLPQQGEEPFAAWGVPSWLDQLRSRGPILDGYRVTFSIGHAIFQTFGAITLDGQDVVFETGLTRERKPIPDALPRLWPMKAEAFHWPPPSGFTFTNSGLQLLVDEGR